MIPDFFYIQLPPNIPAQIFSTAEVGVPEETSQPVVVAGVATDRISVQCDSWNLQKTRKFNEIHKMRAIFFGYKSMYVFVLLWIKTEEQDQGRRYGI